MTATTHIHVEDDGGVHSPPTQHLASDDSSNAPPGHSSSRRQVVPPRSSHDNSSAVFVDLHVPLQHCVVSEVTFVLMLQSCPTGHSMPSPP